MCVKFPICLCVLDPEVGTEVDHFRSGFEQRSRKLNSDAVREREKNHVRQLCQLSGLNISEAERLRCGMMSKARKNFGESFPGELPRRDRCQLRARMT